MEKFTWHDSYSVGDADLDAQHMKIVGILNELYDLLQETNPAPRGESVQRLFQNLTHYIVSHFAFEEDKMVDAGYPENLFEQHRKEHDRFIGHIQRFHETVESGNRQALEEMLPYLYGPWLIDHVCGADHHYIPYLQAAKN